MKRPIPFNCIRDIIELSNELVGEIHIKISYINSISKLFGYVSQIQRELVKSGRDITRSRYKNLIMR